MTAPAVSEAYAECRRIARHAGSSFYLGMSVLPGPRRESAFAIYSLARRIDDLADGDLPAERKLAALESTRAELARIETSTDPVLVAVADTAARYPVPLEAFGDLLDGAEADVRGFACESFPELEHYCRQVAGSIGRLVLGLFDTGDRAAAEPLADDLGVALQLGNILRDLSQDLRQGRAYLPREDVARFGCSLADGRLEGCRLEGPAELLVAFEAQRALGWLRRGLGLVELVDRRSAASLLAMTGVYGRLLERIARDPAVVLARRPSLRGWEKGWVLARSLTRVAA